LYFGSESTMVVGPVLMTVTDTAPDFDPLVAVTIAVPEFTPVRVPSVPTLTVPGLEVDHVTAPDIGAPVVEVRTALACAVPGAGIVVPSITLTEMDARVATDPTVTVAFPVTPPKVAITSAVPLPTAVKEPSVATVTTLVLELDQVGVFPPTSVPDASRGFAVACPVCPVDNDAESVTTVTAVIVGDPPTLTAALPATPLIVATIDVVPFLIGVTTPVIDTVATDGSVLTHDDTV
jgi:hypothetical protein